MVIAVCDGDPKPHPFAGITCAELAELAMFTIWTTLKNEPLPAPGDGIFWAHKLAMETYRHERSFFLAGVAALSVEADNIVRQGFIEHMRMVETSDWAPHSLVVFFHQAFRGEEALAVGWMQQHILRGQFSEEALLALWRGIRIEHKSVEPRLGARMMV